MALIEMTTAEEAVLALMVSTDKVFYRSVMS